MTSLGCGSSDPADKDSGTDIDPPSDGRDGGTANLADARLFDAPPQPDGNPIQLDAGPPVDPPVSTGSITFAEGPYLPAVPGGNYFSVMMADFTSDGLADVIITDHGDGGPDNRYWRGDATAQFVELDHEEMGAGVGTNSTLRGSLRTEVIDFDGDGDLDWWWDDVSPDSLRINQGNGTFVEYVIRPGGPWGEARTRALGKYDDDNVYDLVDEDGNVYSGQLALDDELGDDPDTLGSVSCDPVALVGVPICAADLTSGNEFWQASLSAADFDGDGDLDIVVAMGEAFADNNSVRLYRNNGSPGDYTYVASLPNSMTGGYLSYSNTVAADFDGDGDMDIALAGAAGGMGDYLVFENQGDFAFAAAVDFSDSVPTGKPAIAAGDYDGDGVVDLAMISGSGVRVYRNTSQD